MMSQSPTRRSASPTVTEDEADALELYQMLQDENGVVSASKLNQLVRKYFALETEWVSRGSSVNPNGSVSSLLAASASANPTSPTTVPTKSPHGSPPSSRPTTSNYLVRGVTHRHGSAGGGDGRRPVSAVALPSSEKTAVLAKELTAPQLLSFLLTTRYALAAGVRRRRRQAALAQMNTRSALGDFLTGGDTQYASNEKKELDQDSNRRDIRAMLFAQKQLSKTDTTETTTSGGDGGKQKGAGGKMKRPLYGNGAAPTTTLLRFNDIFNTNELSDEDELIDASDRGFSDQLLTGRDAEALPPAPRARLLPPLFGGAKRATNNRRKNHQRGGLNGSMGSLILGASNNSNSSSASEDEEMVEGESPVTPTLMGLNGRGSGLVSKKATLKQARRASQLDAATMRLFMSELDREFEEIVADYEQYGAVRRHTDDTTVATSAGLSVQQSNTATTATTPTATKARGLPQFGAISTIVAGQGVRGGSGVAAAGVAEEQNRGGGSSGNFGSSSPSYAFGNNKPTPNNADAKSMSLRANLFGGPPRATFAELPEEDAAFLHNASVRRSQFGLGAAGSISRRSRHFSHISGSRANSAFAPSESGNTFAGAEMESGNPTTGKKTQMDKKLKALAAELKGIGAAFLERHNGDTPPDRPLLQKPVIATPIAQKNTSVVVHDDPPIRTGDQSYGSAASASPQRPSKGTKGLNGVVLSQLFPKRHHMEHTVDEVLDAIHKEETYPHGWQDQRRKPGSTVLFVGRSNLSRMAQHGIVIPEAKTTESPSPAHHLDDGDDGVTSTSQQPNRRMKRRLGGGNRSKHKETFLTEMQDRVVPLNRELPAWKKAWKLLSQSGASHGTSRKFNLGSTTKIKKSVRGTGFEALSQQRPYHLTPQERDGILKELVRQKAIGRQEALYATEEALAQQKQSLQQRDMGLGVGGELGYRGSRSPLPPLSPSTRIATTSASPAHNLQTVPASDLSPNRLGKKLQASASSALSALVGWHNHRQLEKQLNGGGGGGRSRTQQGKGRGHNGRELVRSAASRGGSEIDAESVAQQAERYFPSSASSRSRSPQSVGMDSNAYAREHYLDHPVTPRGGGGSHNTLPPHAHSQQQPASGPGFTLGAVRMSEIPAPSSATF